MVWRGYVVVLLCVWWGGGACGGGAEDPAGCGPALDYLTRHNISLHLAHLPSNGSTVCGGGHCCTADVTEDLVVAGRASLSDVVRTTATTLHHTLHHHRHVFHGVLEAALSSSEARAVQVFAATYPRLGGSARAVLHRLYTSLLAALSHGDDAALDRSLAAFWDDVFPPVYHNALHARLPPFSATYAECLRGAARVVQPWGIIPTLVGEPLLRGLHTARLMLHSLDTAIDVVSQAIKFPIASECGEAVARMGLCGACHGATTPPCSGLCLNVARGCLAPLAEVDSAWGDLSAAVARVHESLQAARLTHLLHQLPDKLSEAVMVALERGPKLQKKVRRECGVPSHQETEAAAATTAPDTDAVNNEVEVEEEARGRVLEAGGSALRAVEQARGWWAGVADQHCHHIATQDLQCWNGVRVAPYTKMTAGVGVSAQKYNPEIRVGRPDTSVYALADTLRKVRRLVMSKLTWLPKADAYRRSSSGHGYEGSGSGSVYGDMHYGPPSDDEDTSDYYSGGSGDDPITTAKGPALNAPPPTTQGASSTHVSLSIVLLVLIVSIFSLHG